MIKTVTKTAAVVAVAVFADSVFAGKSPNATQSPSVTISQIPCKYVVVDGYYNILAMLWGSVWGGVGPVYREINPVSGDWGSIWMLLTSSDDFLLYNNVNIVDYYIFWEMQFANQNNFPSVCKLDNWNRAYYGHGEMSGKETNDGHFSILSGTNAAANCIPFPGTIDGEKIPVTSPVVYGVGDCAQAVSMQYPNATGVQVDPWGGPWTTNCYAVFGHTKIDQPNDNNAHRACFFRDAVRPGGLARGTSLGTECGNVEECVKSVKAKVGAQDAKAVGVTFDRHSKECWYHDASELAATNLDLVEINKSNFPFYEEKTRPFTQVHVVFSNPLSRKTK